MNGIAATAGLPNLLQSASATIDRAVTSASQDAATIASSSALDTDHVVSALVDSRQQLLYTQVGAKILRTADQMIGTLLDTLA